LSAEHFDVIVVGAGLSGVGAGVHLQMRCQGKSYVILEGREVLGGTWDLFRYPGIRSDSDMFTLGYVFKPWTEPKAIADGPAILSYINETAREHGILEKIRFNTQVKRASWSSADSAWVVEAERGGARVRFTGNFLLMCSGYYRYEAGYCPEFPGAESFAGRIIYPQRWTEDIDYVDQRIVVIGSGATAVTLVPELAKKAAHVTMLQRSPTYVVARPSVDSIATALRKRLPAKAAYALARWKNVLLGMYFYGLSKRKPERVKQLIAAGVRAALGPDYDVGKHFAPRYNPWDQRLCLAPDGDIFRAIRKGRASVVTDEIETFTPSGVKLRGGEELPADLIVSATGLELQTFGNVELVVDGARIEPAKLITYKGMMYSGLPNIASVFGYTNASWTLKSDLTCEYVCRLLNYMEKHGFDRCAPRLNDKDVQPAAFVDFTPGYFQRALARLPKQGSKMPWRLHQNYIKDLMLLRYGGLTDEAMEFARARSPAKAAARQKATA
jgi:cation diffusion facilitator CzcD-associated flavoprotein CzcO